MTWLMLIAAIASEVAATLSLKGSETTPALYIVVVVGYAIAFALLAAVLKRGMGIGVAYGVWSASGVALTAILATWIFGEAFSPVMGMGIACIVIGVILVETGSQSHAEQSRVDAIHGEA
ncbi:QacE family quaternary ammonium compound efflux SMR transporter [Gordonia sp. zg691]|uniref:QacE family quaternary ammonium compound efflux SMR transporter n=1 Tax=Gordonia jinghuaiqii TaxID=2758710 RepID=A0A7D7QZW7_9ACTN|nr:SMR family transporter [Gordonia jinghuaiqii]MBD0862541.1 QacE family quaternary ammonium compound efflux SMR transporter [Gordonia jinghuaiqii]MCR5976642.1 QacE family quaternary ammonium compound efflux SMR transporter [Gordonia jinghuaiqii]QMS99826.1 QacE family quaternary ammonium compound efflux SMR transporter [Gordonia jinghuaiqii]